MRIRGIVFATTLLVGSSAHALNQSKHYDITVASCTAAGLPSAFCSAAGAADYDVDANEWNDLSAHSQIPNDSDACTAANNSLWRAFWFGEQIRAAALGIASSPSQSGVDTLASDVGRVLHTVQDDCAHAGMPNPQHAWHSLKDTCQGTTESPDIQPAAYACARTETDALFAGLVDVLHDNGGVVSSLARASGVGKSWPAHGDVCDFLASAKTWDGLDRRWDLSIVRPAMTAQLLAALDGASDEQFQRVCATAEDILPRMSDPQLDTSGGAQSCLGVHIYCLGKADENAMPEPPPWETEETAAVTPAPVMSGGCSFGGAAPPPAAPTLVALALFGLLGRALRRRRA